MAKEGNGGAMGFLELLSVFDKHQLSQTRQGQDYFGFYEETLTNRIQELTKELENPKTSVDGVPPHIQHLEGLEDKEKKNLLLRISQLEAVQHVLLDRLHLANIYAENLSVMNGQLMVAAKKQYEELQRRNEIIATMLSRERSTRGQHQLQQLQQQGRRKSGNLNLRKVTKQQADAEQAGGQQDSRVPSMQYTPASPPPEPTTLSAKQKRLSGGAGTGVMKQSVPLPCSQSVPSSRNTSGGSSPRHGSGLSRSQATSPRNAIGVSKIVSPRLVMHVARRDQSPPPSGISTMATPTTATIINRHSDGSRIVTAFTRSTSCEVEGSTVPIPVPRIPSDLEWRLLENTSRNQGASPMWTSGSTTKEIKSSDPRPLACSQPVLAAGSQSPPTLSQLVPLREFEMAGFLLKKGGQSNNRWQRRHFEILFCPASKSVMLTYRVKKKDTALKGCIALLDCEIKELSQGAISADGRPNCFIIYPKVCYKKHKDYYLSAPTREELLKWMDVLMRAREFNPSTPPRFPDDALSTLLPGANKSAGNTSLHAALSTAVTALHTSAGLSASSSSSTQLTPTPDNALANTSAGTPTTPTPTAPTHKGRPFIGGSRFS